MNVQQCHNEINKIFSPKIYSTGQIMCNINIIYRITKFRTKTLKLETPCYSWYKRIWSCSAWKIYIGSNYYILQVYLLKSLYKMIIWRCSIKKSINIADMFHGWSADENLLWKCKNLVITVWKSNKNMLVHIDWRADSDWTWSWSRIKDRKCLANWFSQASKTFLNWTS